MTIKLYDLTNEIEFAPDDGVGVFDKLMNTIELRLDEQYNNGRIKGADYATVYLGALQSTLQQSIAFLLQKEVTAMQLVEAEAKIAKELGYTLSRDSDGDPSIDTNTGTGLLDEQIIQMKKENDLKEAQITKIYADTALVDQQQVTELAQTSDAAAGIQKAKQDLIAAQELGFKTDTKQKLLKQMLDGYAVTLSVAGTATAPDAVKEPAIDAVANDILDDLSSSVNIS